MSEPPPYPPPPSYPPPPEGPPAADLSPAVEPPPTAPIAPPAAGYPTPAGYPPPPAYPAPAYSPPAYGYPPPPAPERVSRNFRAIIAAVIAVVVLLVGVIGYVVGGYAYASSRISDATSTVNVLDSHRSLMNSTFELIDQQVNTLNSITDANVAKTTSGALVTESHTISQTAAEDDHALATARAQLNDQQWLTVLSRGRLDDKAARITHARHAAAFAISAAGDYVQLGQFLELYYQAFVDLQTLFTDAGKNDFVGASGADAALQADVTKALQVTNVPGLPTQFHDVLVDLEAYAGDTAKLLNAIAVGPQSAYDAAKKQAAADLTKASAVDFSNTTSQISTYYKHYRDDFNSELDKATA